MRNDKFEFRNLEIMKRIFLLLMIVLVSGAVMAQPKARRNEAKDKQQTSNANSGMTLRALSLIHI